MRKKILITGAGSAQSNGVINSLLLSGDDEEIIGTGSDAYDLMLSRAHRRYLVPHSRDAEYRAVLFRVLMHEKPDMIHFQHDVELSVALGFRQEIEAMGIALLIPDSDTIDTCVHKYKSWQKFRAAGITVPENRVLHTREDVARALAELGDTDGRIWLRSMAIGGGGKGALPTRDLDEAVEWIERARGWGEFVAAELLTERTVTWLSIWYQGELMVAQSRRRHGWAHSALSPSGVTGVTKIGETCADPVVDTVAERAVRAVSTVPHGVYGVDMAYDRHGVPNPTEINIARFFTTIEFFAQAGLNMPKILKDLALYGKRPNLEKRLNPLPNGLLWLRGMDTSPRLTSEAEMEASLIRL